MQASRRGGSIPPRPQTRAGRDGGRRGHRARPRESACRPVRVPCAAPRRREAAPGSYPGATRLSSIGWPPPRRPTAADATPVGTSSRRSDRSCRLRTAAASSGAGRRRQIGANGGAAPSSGATIGRPRGAVAIADAAGAWRGCVRSQGGDCAEHPCLLISTATIVIAAPPARPAGRSPHHAASGRQRARPQPAVRPTRRRHRSVDCFRHPS